MPSLAVDRDNPVPLYYQLKAALTAEMTHSGLQPGDRLPSESEIEQRFGVSRATVRQALNTLVAEGLIERQQGRGTFVARPKIHHASRLTSFTEDMRSLGLRASHKLLGSVVLEAPEDVADRLAMSSDQRTCQFLRRLFLADEEPVGVADTWLPLATLGDAGTLLEQADVESGSLYDLLQNPPLNLHLHRGIESVSPDTADPDLASQLNCERGTPLLRVERITFTVEDTPIELTRMLFVGSRYEYRAEVFRP